MLKNYSNKVKDCNKFQNAFAKQISQKIPKNEIPIIYLKIFIKNHIQFTNI
jgi:hypothetical protein